MKLKSVPNNLNKALEYRNTVNSFLRDVTDPSLELIPKKKRTIFHHRASSLNVGKQNEVY